MNNFFNPGISFINKLKYPQKFLLLSILFVLLILGLFSSITLGLKKDIGVLNKEIEGVIYIYNLRKLLQNLQQHQGNSNLYLIGEKNYKNKILSESNFINNQIKMIQNLNLNYNKKLTTSRWEEVKAGWKKLDKEKPLISPEENIKEHKELALKILSLMSAIYDTSSHTLNENSSNFYSSDIIVSKFPFLITNMGLSREYSCYYISKGAISDSEQNRIVGLLYQIKVSQGRISRSINKIHNIHPKSDLNNMYKETSGQINYFSELLDNQIIKNYSKYANLKDFYDSASHVIDNNYYFYDYLIDHLKSSLQGQVEKLKGLLLLLILISIVAIFIISYFLISFYLSIIDTITELKKTSELLANGDFSQKVKLNTQDELLELGASLNKLGENFDNFIKREKFLREILVLSISSLDVKNVLSTIVIQTGKFFKADRCLFLEYDNESHNYLPIKDYAIYSSSLSIKDMTNITLPEEMMQAFTRILFNQKEPIAINNIESLSSNIKMNHFFDDYEIKSFIFVPMFYKEVPIGIFWINFTDIHKDFTKEEIEILTSIADQSSVIIHQLKLYEQIRKAEKRERLLRNIINQVLTSQTLQEAVQNIVREVGEVIKTDRTTLRFFDIESQTFSDAIGEYRRNNKIPATKSGVDYTKELNNYIYQEIFEKKQFIIIDDIDSDIYPEVIRDSFKSLNFKSIVIAPVTYKDKPLAAIIAANLESYKSWNKNNIDLLEPIVQQISIGMNLFNANDKLKNSINNERELREIINHVRKFNSHDEVYDYLLSKLIDIFNGETALHFHFDKDKNMFIKNSLKKNREDNILETEIIKCEECTTELMPEEGKVLVINDVAKEINDKILLKFLNSNNIKSFLICPTVKITQSVEGGEEELTGLSLVGLPFAKNWPSAEIDFFKLIVDSISIMYFEIEQRLQLDETKKTFISTLTHDLRSPIHSEQKALEFILSRSPDSNLQNYIEFFEDMYKTNEELLRIVNNILSVYHYESGKIKLNYEYITIKDLITQVNRSLKYLAKDQDSEIILNFDENIPAICADKGEIRRVLTNLISNAIKHTKPHTKINVNGLTSHNYIEIRISDNGQGIPESEKSQIFERYPTTKRQVGSGLGLYLSRQIIEAHNGSIWFESEVDKGTTFYIRLPIKQPKLNM